MKNIFLNSETAKIIVPDTSVAMHDATAIDNFAENIVVAHGCMYEELDNLAGRPEKEFDAREALRKLIECEARGSFVDGIPTPGGGKFFVRFTLDKDFTELPTGLDIKNDNRMILLAYQLQKANPGREVIFVSKDKAPRLKANACGLKAEDYKYDQIEHLYSGMMDINLDPAGADLIDKLYSEKRVESSLILSAALNFKSKDLFPNHCCYIRCGDKTALAIYKKKARIFRVVQDLGNINLRIEPKNSEQLFACHLLLDPEILAVSLMGQAGTGKTLLAAAVGWQQRFAKPDIFKKLLFFRPSIEYGEKQGSLPGDASTKFRPWKQPVYDAFEIILNLDGSHAMPAKFDRRGVPIMSEKPEGVENIVNSYIAQGHLDILPINYQQGGNLRNRFIVADEPQLFKKKDIKMLASRPADPAKIVFTGDPDQIPPAARLDSKSNGLVHLINTYKGEEEFAHLILKEKVYRGRLAEMSAKL